MPRKTKETSENEIVKIANAIKEVLTKNVTFKKSDADKSVPAKKTPEAKKTSSKKASTTKSTTAKKTSKTKKATTKKVSSSKATTTKKTSSKAVATKKVSSSKATTPEKTSPSKTTVTKKASSTKAKTTKNASPSKIAATKKDTSSKTAATKKVSSSKATTTKKTSPSKTVATKKASSPKAAATKKVSSSKATTTRKTSSTKVATTKKSSTKKTTTRKNTATKKTTSNKVAQVDEKKFSAEYYDLPFRYNQTVVKILAQTPNNLFIYWEISDEDRESLKNQYGKYFFEITKPVLIVYNETLNYTFEIEIDDFANSWYLHIDDSNSEYKVELGRRPIPVNYNYIPNYNIEENGPIEELKTPYIYISSSNELDAPNDKILFNKINKVYFRNVKTNKLIEKDVKDFLFMYKD